MKFVVGILAMIFLAGGLFYGLKQKSPSPLSQNNLLNMPPQQNVSNDDTNDEKIAWSNVLKFTERAVSGIKNAKNYDAYSRDIDPYIGKVQEILSQAKSDNPNSPDSRTPLLNYREITKILKPVRADGSTKYDGIECANMANDCVLPREYDFVDATDLLDEIGEILREAVPPPQYSKILRPGDTPYRIMEEAGYSIGYLAKIYGKKDIADRYLGRDKKKYEYKDFYDQRIWDEFLNTLDSIGVK